MKHIVFCLQMVCFAAALQGTVDAEIGRLYQN
jgi:hypothetical protein